MAYNFIANAQHIYSGSVVDFYRTFHDGIFDVHHYVFIVVCFVAYRLLRSYGNRIFRFRQYRTQRFKKILLIDFGIKEKGAEYAFWKRFTLIDGKFQKRL